MAACRLQPVVGAAQAAQVGAGGRAVAGVRNDVVQVGRADPLPAVGHPAGAVPGGDEGLLPAGGLIAVPVGRHPEHRASAVAAGCSPQPVRATRSSSADGGGRQQPPGVVGEREDQAAAVGAGQPEPPIRASSSRTWAAVIAEPVHRPGRRRGAREGASVAVIDQRGRPPRAGRAAGAAQQQREQLGAELPDRPLVPVGLGHLGQLVELRVGLRGLIRGQLRTEGGHAVRAGLQEHIRVPLSLRPPLVDRGGVQLGEQLQRPVLQLGDRQVARLGQQDRLHRPRQPGLVAPSTSASAAARARSSSPAASAANVAGRLSRHTTARWCR